MTHKASSFGMWQGFGFGSAALVFFEILIYRNIHMGVSEIGGTLFWGPYNKDPTI